MIQARAALDTLGQPYETALIMEAYEDSISVLQAELAPAYIARLGDEPVMRGKSFANMVLDQPRAEAGRESPQAPAKEKTTQPGFLEFVLRSSEMPVAETSRPAGGGAQ